MAGEQPREPSLRSTLHSLGNRFGISDRSPPERRVELDLLANIQGVDRLSWPVYLPDCYSLDRSPGNPATISSLGVFNPRSPVR